MVELALAPLVAGRSADDLLALRICDPAIGEGAFLVEIVRVLARALQAVGGARTLADAARAVAPCVIGVDIDARAVEAARGALPGADLRVADALELDWRATWPDVFARGGFDAIVGNPPYVRQELVAAKAALRGYASYDGAADLYVYFIELAHQIARRGARYCLITPSKWMTAAYGRKLRDLLATQGSVEGVVDLARSSLFADADAFPCIVWGVIGEPQPGAIRAARIAPEVSVADALRDAGTPHARHRWRADPWHIDAPQERALLDRLAASCTSLGELVRGRPARGVVTGFNRAFVIDRATRDELLAREPAAARLVRPFVKGRDLRRWAPEPEQRWILLVDRGTSLDELPAVRAHLERFRSALDAPRLFYQDIQTGPACCLDERGLVPDTTVWILPTDDRYLLAVLNSTLYGWYARRRFPPALNGAVRPKREYMRTLPVSA